MSTVCSSMEPHSCHFKYSSYTKRKQSQTMRSNVATNTLPRTLLNQANASTSCVTNDTFDFTIKRKRKGNNCGEQVVPNKILKLKDQAASCSKEKSWKEHSKAVDEDEIVVIYDSSSNSVSKQNGNSGSSYANVNVNHSINLNSDVIDTNNNINDEQNSVGSCRSAFQNVQKNNLSSNENMENLFINTPNCRIKQSKNGMKDGCTRVDSRKYGKPTSNANSTITMKQYYGTTESNQNDTSLSSPTYLVRIGDTTMKMEEELQITDTNEDAVWNSTNVFLMPTVSPIAFEQVRQQPKTEFPEEDVVILSDTEDDTLRHYQLFARFDTNTSMNQEVEGEVIEMEAEAKPEVIEVEAKAEPEDAGISSHVSDNKDGSFPYPQLFDRFDMNRSMNQEDNREVREEKAKAKPEDAGISSYVNNNKDGSFPYPQLFDRFDMNRSMNQDDNKEVREEEAKAEPEDASISSYVNNNKDGSFPYPQLFDRLDMNMSMNQEVNEEVREEEAKAEPEDSGISSYGNEDVVDSLSDSDDEDYRNWMRKLSRSRTLNEDEITKEVKDHVTQEEVGYVLDKSADKSPLNISEDKDDRTVNEMHSLSTISMGRMEVDVVDRAISLKESTSDSTITHKRSFKNKTPSSVGFRRQGNDSRPTSSTTEPTITPSKKSLVRKVIQIEPHHLPTRRRTNIARQNPVKPPKKRLSSKEKKDLGENQKIEDQNKRRAQNESSDCLPASKKKASLLTNVEKTQLMDDNKKEFKKNVTIEEYSRAKDQKCRTQWAAQKTNPLPKEEKKQLMDDRKQKLMQITLKERHLPQKNNQENNRKKKRNTPKVKNTISARKLEDVEDKPKSVNRPAVANDVLASPRTPDSLKDREVAKEMQTQLRSSSSPSGLGRIPKKRAAKAKTKVSSGDASEEAVLSQKIKDIESTLKIAEVAKYKSTRPAIVASSFLKSPESKTTKKIYESNVLNRLARKDMPIPRKSMNDEMTNNFLLRIFKWHPNWLEEQQNELRLGRTAPVVSVDELHEMLTHYKSYDEYYRAMLPRLLLETWYGITRNFPPTGNCRQPTLMCSIVENSVQNKTLSSNLHLTTLMLEVLVTREDREKQAYPTEGDLVLFEYPSLEQEGQKFIKVFAYVDDGHPTILSHYTHCNQDLANYVERPYALITYTIRTKPLKPGILVNKVAKITRVTKLLPNLKMVQALEYLPKSSLMNLILSPKIEEYCLPSVPIPSEQFFTREKLNKKQLEAVFKVTETIVQNQAKLCFIQGPPGAGKSTVIVNIVSQVLYKKKKYPNSEGALKILVCAPTNAAIDEITLRLLQIRSSMMQNWFNIVRIGQMGVTNPIVENICVANLTKQEMKKTRTSSEKSRVQSKINSLNCKMASIHNMCDCAKRLNKKDTREMSIRMQQDAETAVLSQADIITCTLSSIYSKQTETFFMNNKRGISVCIMDEATQSTEAETLIPLMLGVNTLVLVGDPNQLPVTVPSPLGKIEGRDQSIFSRVQNAFEKNPANPIIMLDIQYRMSRDICQWPSKFLYAGNLNTGTPPNKEFPFHSYRLFNIYTSVNSNIAEAQFVANVMYTMLTQANLDSWGCISYGILTPYNKQKPVILAEINNKLSLLPEYITKKIKFEVSTIDGFRGKERDVVILSCLRSQHIEYLSDRQRLSVALTRAKHSLIICGNIDRFNKDPIWNSLLSDAKSRKVYFNVNAQAESWKIKHYVVKRFKC